MTSSTKQSKKRRSKSKTPTKDSSQLQSGTRSETDLAESTPRRVPNESNVSKGISSSKKLKKRSKYDERSIPDNMETQEAHHRAESQIKSTETENGPARGAAASVKKVKNRKATSTETPLGSNTSPGPRHESDAMKFEAQTGHSRKSCKTVSSRTDISESGESKSGVVDVPARKEQVSIDDGSDRPKDSHACKENFDYQPSMDITVHRLPNIEYHPAHIVCIRASPQMKNSSSSFLAISRANGYVEVKSTQQKFRTVCEIAGFRKKLVNALAWTCEKVDGGNKECRLNLVGGSRDGTIFLIDYRSQLLKAVTPSGGGGIFALASLSTTKEGDCRGANENLPSADLVAAGCEDGSIRIFRVGGDCQKIELVSVIPAGSGSAILSVAWRWQPSSPNSEQNGCNETVLYAGVADGTVRRYDFVSKGSSTASNNTLGLSTIPNVSTGIWKSTLRMTLECIGRRTPTRVWALEGLADGTVVTGDSLGHVQFWDGQTGTLIQSFDHNDDRADVLDLAVSSTENKVFACGVDSRIVCIERPGTSNKSKRNQNWLMTHKQRPHTHDVMSMAICWGKLAPEKLKRVRSSGDQQCEILCTGGIDTKLCSYVVEGFEKFRPMNHFPWPTFTPVSQACKKRVVIIRREDKVDLYRLLRTNETPPDDDVLIPGGDFHIGTIAVESSSNLVCSDISHDGRFLAICDAKSLFLFRLDYTDDLNKVIPTQIQIDTSVATSLVRLKFSPKGDLFAASWKGELLQIAMPVADERQGLLKQRIMRAGKEEEFSRLPIQSIKFSADGKWFLIGCGELDAGSIEVFTSRNQESTFEHWWTLPTVETHVSAVRFLERDSVEVAVACINYSFYLFDVCNRRLSTWSEESGVPISRTLPDELVNRVDYPVRVFFNPASKSKLMLGSFGAFVLFDLEQQVPSFCHYLPKQHFRRAKRKRSLSESTNSIPSPKKPSPKDVACVVCLMYNTVLQMDFLDENEMIVVQQPWLNVIATLPEALDRKLYGS